MTPGSITGLHLVSSWCLVAQRSITDRSVDWPTWEQWQRVLLLQDYNTRVVVSGTAMLGLAAGLVGSFTLLRRRALMGDALAHATLPGICCAFMLGAVLGGDGKALPLLLAGAAASGLLGVGIIIYIRSCTRLKEDAALGIVLSVFFGAGVALLALAQQMQRGYAAGLEAFIYGKTASMISADAQLIGVSGLFCVVVTTLLFKEFKLLCFDEGFAGSRGFPVRLLDMVLMCVVVIVTIVGLQAVGLVLMIALLVIPAASARFWTDHMRRLAIGSATLGAISCLVGASLSAIFPKLPSGAMIVLASATFFLISMFCGSRRGVIVRSMRRAYLNRRIDQRHLLRGMFELTEQDVGSQRPGTGAPDPAVDFDRLFQLRSWSRKRLSKAIRREVADGRLEQLYPTRLRLTASGYSESARLVREHRLWELYLITHADIAPSRVDRDADAIEHVLEPEMIAELETLLAGQQGVDNQVPPDPHQDIEQNGAPPEKSSMPPATSGDG